MKKLSILAGMLVGAIVGFLATFSDGFGLKIVLMAFGGLAGTAIGGAIASVGKRPFGSDFKNDALFDIDVTQEDLRRNYWRDKGRPPFVSPMEPEHAHRHFDPDHL